MHDDATDVLSAQQILVTAIHLVQRIGIASALVLRGTLQGKAIEAYRENFFGARTTPENYENITAPYLNPTVDAAMEIIKPNGQAVLYNPSSLVLRHAGLPIAGVFGGVYQELVGSLAAWAVADASAPGRRSAGGVRPTSRTEHFTAGWSEPLLAVAAGGPEVGRSSSRGQRWPTSERRRPRLIEPPARSRTRRQRL